MSDQPQQPAPRRITPGNDVAPDGKPWPSQLAHLKGADKKADDSGRIDFLDREVFCAFRLDNGFITIGLPNGVAGSGLTLREAIDDLAECQMAYEAERDDKT